MAYNIKLTNGQTLVTIPDGSIDTSYSSIYLFGKNCADYGDKQVTNFVHILENFSYALIVEIIIEQIGVTAQNQEIEKMQNQKQKRLRLQPK